MNKDTVTGKAEQVAGKVKQAFGEATGNQKIANSGAAEQIKGAARETWGKTKDTAQDVADSQRADAQVNGRDQSPRASREGHHQGPEHQERHLSQTR